MGSITGYTAARMKEIEDSSVVNGVVQGDNLILYRNDGQQINAGRVKGNAGPQGDGSPGGIGEAPNNGSLYIRRNNAWSILSTNVPPSDSKKYVMKNGAWVVDDQAWKIEFSNSGGTAPSGFTMGSIVSGSAWSIKFSGAGRHVSYTFEFKIDGSLLNMASRVNLPSSLRPIITHTPMAYLYDVRTGYEHSNGFALASFGTDGTVTVPRAQDATIFGLAAGVGGWEPTSEPYNPGVALIVHISGSYVRSSSDLPNAAAYV